MAATALIHADKVQEDRESDTASDLASPYDRTSSPRPRHKPRRPSIVTNAAAADMHSLSHLAQSNDRRLSAAGSVHSGGSDSTSGREVLKKCDVCASLGEERFYCGVCGDIFCNICWIQERAHRKAKEPVHGTPHEKLHYLKAEKIKTSLRQSAKLTDTRGMHDADESSLWFGVSLDPTDNVTPILEDTGRFAMLLAQTSAGDHKPRYPGLVSFIGQTGAGKSALIKTLIAVQDEANRARETPVVGAADSGVPTSGDVHLYGDPKTHEQRYPIIYADCEGLSGGNREPFGAKSKRDRSLPVDKRTRSVQRRLMKIHQTAKRPVRWAKNARQRSREYAVENLYPRLLYTFSDTIVFVERNPRIIEHTIELLVEWAANSFEMTSNQPVLPHLIIAFNASDSALNGADWDVDAATSRVLEQDLSLEALWRNANLEPRLRFWQDRGRQIRSPKELLLSYYSDVRIIRIPTETRPLTAHEQITKLYGEIRTSLETSRKRRMKCRMLLDADELQPYLNYAFDHFSSRLDTPFDFVRAAVTRNRIPNDFPGNLLRLALNMKDASEREGVPMDVDNMLNQLSSHAASCIMLDSVRRSIPGRPEDVFNSHYLEHCLIALNDFLEHHLPCQFANSAGKCINVKSGHEKGHQLGNGKVYAGTYEAQKDIVVYRRSWIAWIKCQVKQFYEEHNTQMEKEVPSESERVAANIHLGILKSFFRKQGGSHEFVSHSTCFSCLIWPPEHALPCGHVICTPCLRMLSDYVDRCHWHVDIASCPFHPDDLFEEPWSVALKPASAGVRVLTLDGGGVRAIMQLEQLRALQQDLGNLPLHLFFDLMVGTSAGGLVALGLGVEGWSAEEGIAKFEAFAAKAFTRRRWGHIPLIAPIELWCNSSKYATEPLEEVLQELYAPGYLFGGGRHGRAQSACKVAVIAATPSRAVVLSNYSRVPPGDEDPKAYAFHRPERPDEEFQIWEAARATSAAPYFFKAFSHAASKQTLMDGAIWHNNPIKIAEAERQNIWPSRANLEPLEPDIVVSVGTGVAAVRLQDIHTPTVSTPIADNRRGTLSFNAKSPVSKYQHWKQLFAAFIESSTNSALAWESFYQALQQQHRPRYRRLNTQTDSDPPQMDDVEQLQSMKNFARHQLDRASTPSSPRLEVRETALRLIALCFFFDPSGKPIPRPGGGFEVPGSIFCRFRAGSNEMRHLGRKLDSFRSSAREESCFVIQETRNEHESQQKPITAAALDLMMTSGTFELPCKIPVARETSEIHIRLLLTPDLRDSDSESLLSASGLGHLISGFPRRLLAHSNPYHSPARLAHHAPVHHPLREASHRRRYRHRLSWDDDEQHLSVLDFLQQPIDLPAGDEAEATTFEVLEDRTRLTRAAGSRGYPAPLRRPPRLVVPAPSGGPSDGAASATTPSPSPQDGSPGLGPKKGLQRLVSRLKGKKASPVEANGAAGWSGPGAGPGAGVGATSRAYGEGLAELDGRSRESAVVG